MEIGIDNYGLISGGDFRYWMGIGLNQLIIFKWYRNQEQLCQAIIVTYELLINASKFLSKRYWNDESPEVSSRVDENDKSCYVMCQSTHSFYAILTIGLLDI